MRLATLVFATFLALGSSLAFAQGGASSGGSAGGASAANSGVSAAPGASGGSSGTGSSSATTGMQGTTGTNVRGAPTPSRESVLPPERRPMGLTRAPPGQAQPTDRKCPALSRGPWYISTNSELRLQHGYAHKRPSRWRRRTEGLPDPTPGYS
jgi:hypothetical protein